MPVISLLIPGFLLLRLPIPDPSSSQPSLPLHPTTSFYSSYDHQNVRQHKTGQDVPRLRHNALY